MQPVVVAVRSPLEVDTERPVAVGEGSAEELRSPAEGEVHRSHRTAAAAAAGERRNLEHRLRKPEVEGSLEVGRSRRLLRRASRVLVLGRPFLAMQCV